MNFAALSLVRHGAPRRGMLLLLVLSMLSLFMVMGALGIVLSTRARESARAFAEASASQVGSPALARAQLDEALMLLLRGSPDDATPVAGGTRLPESLLADRYGNETIVGTLTEDIVVEPGTPLLKAFMSGVQTQNPIELNGRVVTFVPPSGGAGAAVSYRIARVEIPPPSAVNPNPTFWLSHVRTFVPGPAMNPVRPADPPRFPVKGWKVLINGRDFSGRPGSPNESYDAFDEQNEFLTALELRNSRVHGVKRPAFGQRNQQATVDNDNDGVSDGIWIEGLLPEQSSLGGGTLTFDVSYLVLDLDGRINLNAHGSMSVLQDDPGKYPHKVPLGMGFGPADVDATLVVPGRDPNKPFETWGMLLGGGRPRPVSTVSSTNQWRPPALVTQNVDGRYGPHLQPGDPGVDLMPAGIVPEMFAENWLRPRRPPGEALTSIDAGASWMYTAQENTPDMINPVTDLKVRTQVFTTNVASGVPAMRYFRPPSPGVRPIPPPPPWRNEEADLDNDPYEMRIDIDLGRQSKLGSAAAADNVGGDALFSIAELERVLRQYDNDAATLPPRLAVILDDLAERSRMTVTTDSWDTPGLVGEAAHKVEDYAVALPKTVIYDVLSPDITAGLRFNVNRPILQKTVSVEATTEKEAMTKAEDTDRERYDWMALFAIRGNGNAWNVTMDNRWSTSSA